MLVPLVVLAAGALLAGYLNVHERLGEFLGKSPSFQQASMVVAEHYRSDLAEVHQLTAALGQEDLRDKVTKEEAGIIHLQMMVISSLIALGGIALAYMLHLHNRPAGDKLVRRFPGVTRLLEGKYYVDEIYDALIVQPLWLLGRGFYALDRMVVDGLIWLVGFVPQGAGFVVKLTTQRGQVQGYALSMLAGVVVILVIVFAGLR
jgi:NADH:ubiquinone oxidoreductase subunit 5 (subunit L)/multisubunit Na+/H+ antiporter MnhA subunit